MEQNNKITVGYCRVASFDEAAIQNQEKMLRLFAQEQGIGEIDVYSDNGYSGLNLDRLAFNRLEADIQNGKIHVVIAIDEPRIARNYFLVSDWIDKMERLGMKADFRQSSR